MNGMGQLDVGEIVPNGVEVTQLDLPFGGTLLFQQSLGEYAM